MANYYNKDLYKVLDLTYEASAEEIKASFRKLARTYHPDVATTPEDVEKFKEIKEAYDILSNEETRKKYDVLRGFYREKLRKDFEKEQKTKEKYQEYIKKAKQHANNPESFGKTFNDAIDNLFHAKKSTKATNAQQKAPINGEDINVDVTITCFEAVNGTNRKVNILHTQPCPNCGGRKFINESQCAMCKGQGIISLQKKINVKIPKGVSQGSKVRVKKEGNKGLNGGKDGDLYLIITVEKHPFFEIDGLNILCNLPITPFEAALGAEVTVPAIEGNVNVKIPPMTSSGQKLRLAGQGIENKNKSKKGDMIITISIKMPEKLSEEEKELYSKLKELSSHNIRKDMKNDK